MGCDIHTFSERRTLDGQWETVKFAPFDWRSYAIFGFLAGVRNSAMVTPISEPRGLPEDARSWVIDQFCGMDYHTPSWLGVQELLDFDYEQIIENQRCTRQLGFNYFSGAETCDVGEGEKTTYREFLGEGFFADLNKLKELNADRIVFAFDS